MKIEKLCVDNLREGIFCAASKPHGEEMWEQLEAWMDGNLLRGQIARTDEGEVAGFVIYYPIENAPMDVDGDGLYMVQCVHVMPKHQNSGVGRALVESAISDAKSNGGSGLAAEGFAHESGAGFDYLPGAFFAHMGMTPSDSRGHGTLYYVGFEDNTTAPQYLEPDFKPVVSETPKIKVDILDCRRCHLLMQNRSVVETVLAGLGTEKVDLKVHEQSHREAIVDKGMASGIFIDGKLTYFEGPINEEDVWHAIEIADTARRQSTDR